MRHVNTGAACFIMRIANNERMPEAKLTPSQKADAARLKAIYVAKKKKDQALTQEALADLCGWNSQGPSANT